MNILLASVKTLPKLINGKVCVINEGGTFSLYNPSIYTTIKDDFDPLKYAILISDRWAKCIVYAKPSDQEHYLVNKQIEELNTKSKVLPYRIGDKIHIHSRRGIYKVVEIADGVILITCGVWQYDANPNHTILSSDFKCLAGGNNNIAHF